MVLIRVLAVFSFRGGLWNDGSKAELQWWDLGQGAITRRGISTCAGGRFPTMGPQTSWGTLFCLVFLILLLPLPAV